MTWLCAKAARAAIGLSALFLILALTSLWLAFRLMTFPIRKLSPAGSAKRSAMIGLVQAIFVLAAAVRTTSTFSSAGSESASPDTTSTAATDP